MRPFVFVALSWSMLMWTACHTLPEPQMPDSRPRGGRIEALDTQRRSAPGEARVLRSISLRLEHVEATLHPWLQASPFYHTLEAAFPTCEHIVVVIEKSRWLDERAWLVDTSTDTRHQLPFVPDHLVMCHDGRLIVQEAAFWPKRVALFDMTTHALHTPEIIPPAPYSWVDIEDIIPVISDDPADERYILQGKGVIRNARGDVDRGAHYYGLWSPGDDDDEVHVRRSELWTKLVAARSEREQLSVRSVTLIPQPSHPSRGGTCCGPSRHHVSYTYTDGAWKRDESPSTFERAKTYTYEEQNWRRPGGFHELGGTHVIDHIVREDVETTWSDGLTDTFLDTRSGQIWLGHTDYFASTSQSHLGAARTLTRRPHDLAIYLTDFDAGTQQFLDTYEDCPGQLEATQVIADMVAWRCGKWEESRGKYTHTHYWSEMFDTRRGLRWRTKSSQIIDRILPDSRVIVRDTHRRDTLWVATF